MELVKMGKLILLNFRQNKCGDQRLSSPALQQRKVLMPLLQWFSSIFLDLQIYIFFWFGNTFLYFTVNAYSNNESKVNKSLCPVKCLQHFNFSRKLMINRYLPQNVCWYWPLNYGSHSDILEHTKTRKCCKVSASTSKIRSYFKNPDNFSKYDYNLLCKVWFCI